MGNVDGIGIPLPANEQVWESWVQHLLGKKYGKPANAYGGRGFKQDGIDFTVYDGDVRVGVQCKFVSPASKLNVSQVSTDIQASRAILPPIGRFLLYSSAKSDPKTANALDKLKAQARDQGIEFEWLLSRDFDEEVRTYDLFDRLNGLESLAPASEPAASPAQAASRPSRDSTGMSTQSATPIQTSATILYSLMLDDVKDRINAGDSAGAIALVESILKRSSQVPSTELARAYATKAILISRAGQIREAAGLWYQAAEIEPDPNLRHGRKAQALLCEDRFEEALEAALPGLEVDPPSVLSAIVALTAGQHLERRAEIDTSLSERLKRDRDVGLVRAHVALADGKLAFADELAETVDTAYPNDADVIGLRADILLHKAIGGPGRLRTNLLSGTELVALGKALPLYQQSLAQRDPHRDRAGWVPSALNFLSALKLLDRHREAADLALKVTDAFGSDVDDIGRFLLALAEGGQEARALKLAAQVTNGDVTVSLARASALLHLERFGEAEKLLEQLQVGAADGQDADNIGWMLVAAKIHANPSANLADLGQAFYEAAHSKLAACARMVENAARLGHRQLAKEYAARAIELYEKEPDPEFLPLIADSLLTLDRHDDAIRLLLPQVDLDHPQGGPLEERLAFCLLRQHRIESLGKLLSGLSSDAPDAAQFDPYRIDYQFARGDRPAALRAIRDAIARRPGDLQLHALEAALLRQQGDMDEAKEKLLAAKFHLDASLHAVALYVHEARECGQDLLADNVAYQWIREHGSHPDNAAWFLTEFLVSRSDHGSGEPLKLVATRCGVLLKPSDADQRPRWIVIDDRYPERVAEGWFAPHSDHVASLIGEPAASIVQFDGFPGGPFTIELILPVFDGAFQLVQSRYGRDVPMAGSLRYVPLKREGEDFNFAPIFKMLDESKEATQRALSIYAETPMPIGVLAHAMNRNPIDLWAGLVGTERHVRAMSGDSQAAAAFAQRLQDCPPHIVLDPVTLMGWDAFGLLPLVNRATDSISMTASSVAVIRKKLDEIELGSGRPKMMLAASEEAGKYIRTEVTPEMAAASRQVFMRALQWIEDHAQVLPVPPSGLPEDTYAAMSKSWPSYIADSMQLAAHDGRVLVADDIGIEALSAASLVMQVPTAALLRAAAAAKRITAAEFAQALRELVQANYEFISFSAEDLWAVTGTDSNSVTPDVAVMLRYLRIESLNVISGVGVVRGYLRKLASTGVRSEVVASCMTISLSALTRDATRETTLVFRAFVEICKELPDRHARTANTALVGWLQGHFLTLEHVDYKPKSDDVSSAKRSARATR